MYRLSLSELDKMVHYVHDVAERAPNSGEGNCEFIHGSVLTTLVPAVKIKETNVEVLTRGDAIFLPDECGSFVMQYRGLDRNFDVSRVPETSPNFPNDALMLWTSAADEWLREVSLRSFHILHFFLFFSLLLSVTLECSFFHTSHLLRKEDKTDGSL